MGLFNKFMDGLKMNQNENDDYFLDDDYGDEDIYEHDEDDYKERTNFFSKKSSGNSASDKIGGIFNRKVISGGSELQVVTIRPILLQDFNQICDYLLDGKAVIMNMEGINKTDSQRISDFTFGAISSIGGDFQKITDTILIASPHNVELSGDYIGDLQNDTTSQSHVNTRPNSFSFNS